MGQCDGDDDDVGDDDDDDDVDVGGNNNDVYDDNIFSAPERCTVANAPLQY